MLDIVTWPAKILETKSEEVKVFDDDLRSFVKAMQETMAEHKGIGLAANQVGVAKQIIVIKIPFDETQDKMPWHDLDLVFINPRLSQKIGKRNGKEGCLSFPNVHDFVERADEVVVTAQNEYGEWFTVIAKGMFSTALQHEIDHINGIVFIKRMSRLKASMILKKLK